MPKPLLRADRAADHLVLDTALDWVLDQHKEKTPRDPTIRARFDSYRFADHKERVADLLARVTRVSVETVAIVGEMRALPRESRED